MNQEFQMLAKTFKGLEQVLANAHRVVVIDGVVDAKQYTVPVQEALDSVRAGKNPDLSTREKHLYYLSFLNFFVFFKFTCKKVRICIPLRQSNQHL